MMKKFLKYILSCTGVIVQVVQNALNYRRIYAKLPLKWKIIISCRRQFLLLVGWARTFVCRLELYKTSGCYLQPRFILVYRQRMCTKEKHAIEHPIGAGTKNSVQVYPCSLNEATMNKESNLLACKHICLKADVNPNLSLIRKSM